MRRKVVATGIAVGALAMGIGQVAAAEAATVRTLSCSKGGFTGTMYVRGTERDVDLYYKIDRGSKPGGNQADVFVHDRGVVPPKRILLVDGIQDGNEHFFASYRRGSGRMNVTFTFDKRSALDPSCETSAKF